MTLARVYHRFDMELADTTAKIVAIEKVHITGYPRLKGGRANSEAEVKVKITHKLGA